MNRIYRFFSLLVLLMAATVTLSMAFTNGQDDAGCSSDETMPAGSGDLPAIGEIVKALTGVSRI